MDEKETLKKDRNSRKSIKNKFLLIFFVLVLLPCIIIMIYSISLYSKYVVDNIITSKYNTIHAINETIDTKLEQYRNMGKMIYYNNLVMDVMSKADWDESDVNIVEGYLSSIVNAEPYIESAMITKGNEKYLAGNEYQNLDDYIFDMKQSYVLENIALKWLPTVKLSNNYGHDVYPSVCYRTINDENGQVGTLWLFVSNRLYSKIINSDFKYHEGDIYIVDSEQIIVASSISDIASKEYHGVDISNIINNARGYFKNSNEEIIIYDKSYETDWYIINITPLSIVLKENTRITILVAGLFGLGLLSISLLYILMSSRLTKPLVALKKGLSRVADGDFEYQVAVKSKGKVDEIGELTNTYNYMIDKIQLLMVQIREEEKLKNKEKIKLLSMQIGPHFIYNTLNSLKWMAVINKQKNIQRMTESLIKLLVNVTYDIGEMVTLKNELELLRCYIYIQKVRYSNFDVQYDVPENLLKCKVNKMLLQPIIENCIIHGFSGKKDMGIITISANREDKFLIISIKDNGKGFKSNNQELKMSQKKSIGIGNIKERIRLNFGSEYSLIINSEKEAGTHVNLKLPYIIDQQQNSLIIEEYND